MSNVAVGPVFHLMTSVLHCRILGFLRQVALLSPGTPSVVCDHGDPLLPHSLWGSIVVPCLLFLMVLSKGVKMLWRNSFWLLCNLKG